MAGVDGPKSYEAQGGTIEDWMEEAISNFTDEEGESYIGYIEEGLSIKDAYSEVSAMKDISYLTGDLKELADKFLNDGIKPSRVLSEVNYQRSVNYYAEDYPDIVDILSKGDLLPSEIANKIARKEIPALAIVMDLDGDKAQIAKDLMGAGMLPSELTFLDEPNNPEREIITKYIDDRRNAAINTKLQLLELKVK